MAIRGIICLGLLDSTSDVLTLGLTPAELQPIDAGIEITASVGKHNTSASVTTHNVTAAVISDNPRREPE